MKLVGMMRVKNEERWLHRSLPAMLAFCSPVIVFDDHSTDGTPTIVRALGAQYVASPFSDMSEPRDKNYLYRLVLEHQPDWIVSCDGDEEFSAGARAEFLAFSAKAPRQAYVAFRMLYFWNDLETVRMDGIYGRFYAPRAFRPVPNAKYPENKHGGFHCGSIPSGAWIGRTQLDAPIYHYGYVDAADRRRKHEFYRKYDPANAREDNYRHLIQGDPDGPNASAKLLHAGPLKLEPHACAG